MGDAGHEAPEGRQLLALEQDFALLPDLHLDATVIEMLTDPVPDVGEHREQGVIGLAGGSIQHHDGAEERVLAADREGARGLQPDPGSRGCPTAHEALARPHPARLAGLPDPAGQPHPA